MWAPDHPVRQVLQARRATGSKPGRREDGCKVGLAVEGGGMRGVVSGAMLTALEELGYADCFDDVYACSSGAVNGAYFVTRDTWFPLSVYFDDLTTDDFLNLRRVRRGLMDVHWLFDVVLGQRKPLDYDAIVASAQRLHVMVSDVDTMEALDVTDFSSAADLRSALTASVWLPFVVRGRTTFRGHRAMDGGILRFHPASAAVLDGCTHILSLSTKPMGTMPSDRRWRSLLMAKQLDRVRPGLGTGYLSAMRQYLRTDRPWLTRGMTRPGEPAVLDLAPLPGTPEVKRFERDRGRVIDGSRSAYRVPYLALEEDDVLVVPRLTVRSLSWRNAAG